MIVICLESKPYFSCSLILFELLLDFNVYIGASCLSLSSSWPPEGIWTSTKRFGPHKKIISPVIVTSYPVPVQLQRFQIPCWNHQWYQREVHQRRQTPLLNSEYARPDMRSTWPIFQDNLLSCQRLAVNQREEFCSQIQWSENKLSSSSSQREEFFVG